jgi:tetratricopeptide (TPR) repeat protein
MDNQNSDETIPIPIGEEQQEPAPPGDTVPTMVAPPPENPSKRRWITWLLMGLLALIVLGIFVVAGGFLGYQQGIAERKDYEATQVASAIDEQYELGLQDMVEGRYEVARQRFDYVIQNDPGFPGVIDSMAEVQLILNATATPTPIPPTLVPTEIPLTPTPDLRGEEELFVHAQNMIAEQQWSEAIIALETLRKKNPDYEAIDVDGMFFVAFRNRGAQNIGAGNLESGIYDLTLAERFGVLDTEANGYRTWARYYITGASFWAVDWAQAVYYFGQVAPQYPSMHDGTGWTASQRYVEAIIGYAQWFEAQNKWCAAEEQYHNAFEITGNSEYKKARDIASDKCNSG